MSHTNNWNEVMTPEGPSFPVGPNFKLRDTYGREWNAKYTDGTNFDICVNGRWQWPDPALRYTHWQEGTSDED